MKTPIVPFILVPLFFLGCSADERVLADAAQSDTEGDEVFDRANCGGVKYPSRRDMPCVEGPTGDDRWSCEEYCDAAGQCYDTWVCEDGGNWENWDPASPLCFETCTCDGVDSCNDCYDSCEEWGHDFICNSCPPLSSCWPCSDGFCFNCE